MPDNTTDSAKTADRLKRLIEIATQLNATYHSDELLQMIMTGATELTDATTSSLLCSASRQSLPARTGSGSKPGKSRRRSPRKRDRFSGVSAESRSAQVSTSRFLARVKAM